MEGTGAPTSDSFVGLGHCPDRDLCYEGYDNLFEGPAFEVFYGERDCREGVALGLGHAFVTDAAYCLREAGFDDLTTKPRASFFASLTDSYTRTRSGVVPLKEIIDRVWDYKDMSMFTNTFLGAIFGYDLGRYSNGSWGSINDIRELVFAFLCDKEGDFVARGLTDAVITAVLMLRGLLAPNKLIDCLNCKTSGNQGVREIVATYDSAASRLITDNMVLAFENVYFSPKQQTYRGKGEPFPTIWRDDGKEEEVQQDASGSKWPTGMNISGGAYVPDGFGPAPVTDRSKTKEPSNRPFSPKDMGLEAWSPKTPKEISVEVRAQALSQKPPKSPITRPRNTAPAIDVSGMNLPDDGKQITVPDLDIKMLCLDSDLEDSDFDPRWDFDIDVEPLAEVEPLVTEGVEPEGEDDTVELSVFDRRIPTSVDSSLMHSALRKSRIAEPIESALLTPEDSEIDECIKLQPPSGDYPRPSLNPDIVRSAPPAKTNLSFAQRAILFGTGATVALATGLTAILGFNGSDKEEEPKPVVSAPEKSSMLEAGTNTKGYEVVEPAALKTKDISEHINLATEKVLEASEKALEESMSPEVLLNNLDGFENKDLMPLKFQVPQGISPVHAIKRAYGVDNAALWKLVKNVKSNELKVGFKGILTATLERDNPSMVLTGDMPINISIGLHRALLNIGGKSPKEVSYYYAE